MPSGPVEWTRDALPAGSYVAAIGGTAANDVWAVGNGIFHYDGATWSDALPPHHQPVGLGAISVVARDDVWAVGGNGLVAHFDGKTWTLDRPDVTRVSPTMASHYDLLDVSAWAGEVWVSASRADYYRFDGKTWSAVHAVRSMQMFWGSSPHDVWLPGGVAAHFDGKAWSSMPQFPRTVGRSVHGTSASDVWMVGWVGPPRDKVGSVTHFDGATWTEVPMPAETRLLWTVYAARADEAYAVGDDGTAVVWNGKSWRTTVTGLSPGDASTLLAIYSPGGGVAFASGDSLGAFVLHKH